MIKVETQEILLVRIDISDHEVGSAAWQDRMTHNIVVSLLKSEPLTSTELAFIRVQNEHLKNLKGQK